MTAFAVSLFRALESEKRERLIEDPVAVALFSPLGPAPLRLRLARFAYSFGGLERPLVAAFSSILRQKAFKPGTYVNLLAARTRYIDDIVSGAMRHGLTQLVVLGAGLDARSVRLKALQDMWDTVTPVTAFEVDFAPLLAEKHRLFEEAGFALPSWVVQVGTDFSADDPRWDRDLLAAGFNPALRSIWLLEGLTGYLSDVELAALQEKIAALAAPGSRLVATWMGTQNEVLTKMHISSTDNPDVLLSPLGWRRDERVSVEEVGRRYGRPFAHPGYWLTHHIKG